MFKIAHTHTLEFMKPKNLIDNCFLKSILQVLYLQIPSNIKTMMYSMEGIDLKICTWFYHFITFITRLQFLLRLWPTFWLIFIAFWFLEFLIQFSHNFWSPSQSNYRAYLLWCTFRWLPGAPGTDVERSN